MPKKKKTKSKYPPYPGTNWDYGARMAAGQCLTPPNKSICIYCMAQALTQQEIKHAEDCPAKDEE
jgi:hypothetical protein